MFLWAFNGGNLREARLATAAGGVRVDAETDVWLSALHLLKNVGDQYITFVSKISLVDDLPS